MSIKAPLCPYIIARVTGLTELASSVNVIPGVRVRGDLVYVPHHAISLLDTVLRSLYLNVESAKWVNPREADPTWAQVDADLRAAGEVREWVLDGFLTEYQREALVYGYRRVGVHFWHTTGCLAGDTLIPVNRAGKGFTLPLKELYGRFHHALPARGKKWDKAIPTQAACEIDGVIRLNDVLDVVYSGRKQTFEVRAGGFRVRGTADHKFLTPSGFVRLGDLRVGDSVIQRGTQQAAKKEPKKRYKLHNVKGHPYAQLTESKLSDRVCLTHRYKPGHTVQVYRVPEHRLVYEAHINGLTLEALKSRCRAGEIGGLQFFDPAVYAVHHKNRDHLDNRVENLELLTHEEHTRHHGHEHSAENVLFKAVEVAVESIAPFGEEDTFDISMKSPHNNFVANEFVVHNSGKTLTAILIALLRSGPVIVVTRAASRIQYGREVERFTNLRPYVIRPTATMKKNALTLDEYMSDTSSRRVVVVGWEALANVIEPLLKIRPSTVVYDEAHKSKGHRRYDVVPLAEVEDPQQIIDQAAEARARGGFISEKPEGRVMLVPVENIAANAARLARVSDRRVLTTATPIKDRVRDLWSQLDLAEPDAWGSATAWMDRHTARKPGVYGGYDTSGSSNLDELAERLQHVVHKVDYRVTHRSLPPKRRQSVYVAPEDQCKPSGGFQKELVEAAKRGPSALLEANLALAASKKRKAVIGLVEDHLYAGQKVIIFTGRRRDCEELGKAFKDTKAQVWASHGGDSTATRQQVVDDYMSHPGPCLLVGTGDAFGEALNLHDTDALLFVMLPWTPGQVRQWEGRVARLGQKRPVTIYYVVAEGTVDEHVADKLISKLPAVEEVSGDTELAEAGSFIAGTEDEEKLTLSILDKLARMGGESGEDDE